MHRADLLADGGSDTALRAGLRSGEHVRVAKDLYRMGSGPETETERWQFELDLRCALSPEGLVCGQAAAALHGLDGFDPGLVPIVIDVGRRGRAGPGRVRRARLDAPSTCQRWPVTSVAETLLDLGDGLEPRPGCAAAVRYLAAEELVELAVESALHNQLVTAEELGDLLATVSPLRRGASVLARVLAGRPPGTVPTQSYLESRIVQELRNAGLPVFERQVETFDEEGRIGFVDFRRDLVVIEGVGEEWHVPKFDPDHERYARLGSGPFLFIPATFNNVERGTARFVDRVARAVYRAGPC